MSAKKNTHDGSESRTSSALPSLEELEDSKSSGSPRSPYPADKSAGVVNEPFLNIHPKGQNLYSNTQVLNRVDVSSRPELEKAASPDEHRNHDSAHLGTNHRNLARIQTRLSSKRSANIHEAQHTTPTKASPGIFNVFNFMWHSRSKTPTTKDDFKQRRDQIVKHREHSPDMVCRSYGTSHHVARYEDDITKMKQEFENTLEAKDRQREASKRDFESRTMQLKSHIKQLKHDYDEQTQVLQTRLRKEELDKLAIKQDYDTYVRKHQEASFRKMESARWLPKDEGKVVDDLDRLKRGMRSWAKGTSIGDFSLLRPLDDTESTDLIENLAHVVILNNNDLPQVLISTARAPMLLLNALVADSVYTSFFRTPFFFLNKIEGDSLSEIIPGTILEWMYQLAETANQQDAHIWRSQTLRLWMPPQRNDTSDAEKHLRSTTEMLIAQIASRRASDFLAGPARHLINSNTDANFTTKLRDIYNEAANIAYMLWTRRTYLRCFTLHEIPHLVFDAESPYFDPDSLVRYDEHEDQLKGMPVTLMVHPLLQVFGTDEAEDYHKERVWAKGVVWLDSREV